MNNGIKRARAAIVMLVLGGSLLITCFGCDHGPSSERKVYEKAARELAASLEQVVEATSESVTLAEYTEHMEQLVAAKARFDEKCGDAESTYSSHRALTKTYGNLVSAQKIWDAMFCVIKQTRLRGVGAETLNTATATLGEAWEAARASFNQAMEELEAGQ